MRRSIWVLGLLAVGLALVVGLAGCDLITQILNPTTGTDIPWVIGEEVLVDSQTIGTGGGSVDVSDPGGPLDGMEVSVPAGAYPASKTFDISYAAVSDSIAPDFNALTPLITVDNGGDYAEEVMTVTIPIELPEGHFAMGFFVGSGGELEGMPLIELAGDSITVGTMHFSSFIIASTPESTLMTVSGAKIEPKGIVDSGFRPMVDDWQFPNYGSYIAEGGHCAGQALSALWYYNERTMRGTSSLHGRFDNNGDTATPDLWEDDSYGYRLASVVQKDITWSSRIFHLFTVMGATADATNWKAFLYSIGKTNKPQMVGIYDTDKGGGHAMIVYKVDTTNGYLHVADPNYPGNTGKKIEYANHAFKPYISGDNVADIEAGKGKSFERIWYFGRTAYVPWGKIGNRWSEFDAGTIGDQNFPGYQLSALDSTGGAMPLTDGMTYSGDKLKIGLDADDPTKHTLGYYVYRDDQELTVASDGSIDLLAGENNLGIYILGETGGNWEYVDFQRVTVNTASAGYVYIRVDVYGYLTHVLPNTLDPDTGEIGYTFQDDDPFEVNAFQSYAGRSFTGDTFHAQWSNCIAGGCGPFSGSMTVTFSENMDEVISFSASDSYAYDGNVLTWAASGSNIPLDRIGNGFYEYIMEGAECCSHLGAYVDDIAWAGGNTITLTHFTCDVTARIQVQWYEQPPEWVGTSDLLQTSSADHTPEDLTERAPLVQRP